MLAVGCASSSYSWDSLKCSWNVGQLCSCAGRLRHSRISWVKTPEHCRMIMPMLISCSFVAGDFVACAMREYLVIWTQIWYIGLLGLYMRLGHASRFLFIAVGVSCP